jgi:uncharacterized protein
MREDVSFDSHGVVCRGWFYKPQSSPAPAIVMSHGFSAVKEQSLDRFASAFQSAGFAVLLFDYRFLGASGGTPRQRIIPTEQHDDLRAALSWICARDDVDKRRVGMWGTSYSGGHSLVMAALDSRIKAVVAQVAAVDLKATILGLVGRDGLNALLDMFTADHVARNAGQGGDVLPVVGLPGGVGILTTPGSHEWFTETAKSAANWKNEVTVESVARLVEYAPGNFIDLIAPKPLLMQAGINDSIIPITQLREAFAQAGEPKKLDEFDCGHFDFYEPGPWHDRAVNGAVEWFKKYL